MPRPFPVALARRCLTCRSLRRGALLARAPELLREIPGHPDALDLHRPAGALAAGIAQLHGCARQVVHGREARHGRQAQGRHARGRGRRGGRLRRRSPVGLVVLLPAVPFARGASIHLACAAAWGATAAGGGGALALPFLPGGLPRPLRAVRSQTWGGVHEAGPQIQQGYLRRGFAAHIIPYARSNANTNVNVVRNGVGGGACTVAASSTYEWKVWQKTMGLGIALARWSAVTCPSGKRLSGLKHMYICVHHTVEHGQGSGWLGWTDLQGRHPASIYVRISYRKTHACTIRVQAPAL